MRRSALSISISIPAYNEAQTLPDVITQSAAVLAQCTSDFEIVVIDDGSTDATPAVLERLAQTIPQLKILRHPRNAGLGVTLREVFEVPTKDAIFFLPGDGQIPPVELKTLLPHLDQADLIVGWRKVREDPFSRRVMAFLYNLFLSLIMRRRIHDADSVVLIKRNIYHALAARAQSAFLHAELILRAERQGVRWREIPIRHVARRAGNSKITNHRILGPLFIDLFKYLFSAR